MHQRQAKGRIKFDDSDEYQTQSEEGDQIQRHFDVSVAFSRTLRLGGDTSCGPPRRITQGAGKKITSATIFTPRDNPGNTNE